MNKNLSRELSCLLRGAKRIVAVGIGNTLKGDDGAGVQCVKLLGKKLRGGAGNRLKIINAGAVPENYTGRIRSFKPSHIILIDSCYGRKRPGSVFIVDKNAMKDDNVSTHHLPLKYAVRYFEETMGSKVVILGIEPECPGEGEGLSRKVNKAVVELAGMLAVLVK